MKCEQKLFLNTATSYHCRQEIDSTLDRLKKVERDLTLKEKQLKERESKLKEREKHLEQQFKVVVGEKRTTLGVMTVQGEQKIWIYILYRFLFVDNQQKSMRKAYS